MHVLETRDSRPSVSQRTDLFVCMTSGSGRDCEGEGSVRGKGELCTGVSGCEGSVVYQGGVLVCAEGSVRCEGIVGYGKVV